MANRENRETGQADHHGRTAPATLDEFDGLSEDEFDDLSTLGRFSMVSFALAATALTVAIGLWIEPDPGMGPASQAESRQFLLETVAPVCAAASLLFALFGFVLVARRRRLLAAIARRQAMLDGQLHRSQGTIDPALSDSQRSPSRSLMRW